MNNDEAADAVTFRHATGGKFASRTDIYEVRVRGRLLGLVQKHTTWRTARRGDRTYWTAHNVFGGRIRTETGVSCVHDRRMDAGAEVIEYQRREATRRRALVATNRLQGIGR